MYAVGEMTSPMVFVAFYGSRCCNQLSRPTWLPVLSHLLPHFYKQAASLLSCMAYL